MKPVLLLNPPAFFADGAPRVFEREAPPLGLLYLASYVHAHSARFDVRVVDVGPENLGVRDLRTLLQATRPFAVGISAMTLQLQGARDLAMLVRESCPATPVFMGGAHASADPQFVDRHADAFDHAITGEAETVFLESLRRLDEGRDLPRIQQGQAVPTLDDLPFPNRGLVRRERYLRPEYFILARGCPYQCYFCSSPATSGKVRHRSVENLLEEMVPYLAQCRGQLSFADDSFTLDRSRVLDLCREIARRSLSLRWRCVTRIDLLDEELVRAMRGAGCEIIGFGIESGSERVRRQVLTKGGFSNARVHETVGLCRKHGIRVNAFFMIGNPGETPEEIDETEDMIFRLGLDGVAISVPIPFPGSPLYDMAERDGIIDRAAIDRFARKEMGEGCTGVYPLYIRDLERDYVLGRMKRMFWRFYLRPGVAWGILRRDLAHAGQLREDLRSLWHLLTRGGSRRRPFV